MTSVQNSRGSAPHAPILGLCAVFLGALLFVACGSEETSSPPGASSLGGSVIPDSLTIVRMLGTDDRFSILRAGLDSTQLDSVLATEGPFTLFAPPDEAFEALPPGTVDALFTDQQERLHEILSHHVLTRDLSLSDARGTRRIVTLSGDSVVVRVGSEGEITVNGSRVVDRDIETSNGRIHVIQNVLPPPESDGGS